MRITRDALGFSLPMKKSEEMGVEFRHKFQYKPTRRLSGKQIPNKLRSLRKRSMFS